MAGCLHIIASILAKIQNKILAMCWWPHSLQCSQSKNPNGWFQLNKAFSWIQSVLSKEFQNQFVNWQKGFDCWFALFAVHLWCSVTLFSIGNHTPIIHNVILSWIQKPCSFVVAFMKMMLQSVSQKLSAWCKMGAQVLSCENCFDSNTLVAVCTQTFEYFHKNCWLHTTGMMFSMQNFHVFQTVGCNTLKNACILISSVDLMFWVAVQVLFVFTTASFSVLMFTCEKNSNSVLAHWCLHSSIFTKMMSNNKCHWGARKHVREMDESFFPLKFVSQKCQSGSTKPKLSLTAQKGWILI